MLTPKKIELHKMFDPAQILTLQNNFTPKIVFVIYPSKIVSPQYCDWILICRHQFHARDSHCLKTHSVTVTRQKNLEISVTKMGSPSPIMPTLELEVETEESDSTSWPGRFMEIYQKHKFPPQVLRSESQSQAPISTVY